MGTKAEVLPQVTSPLCSHETPCVTEPCSLTTVNGRSRTLGRVCAKCAHYATGSRITWRQPKVVRAWGHQIAIFAVRLDLSDSLWVPAA